MASSSSSILLRRISRKPAASYSSLRDVISGGGSMIRRSSVVSNIGTFKSSSRMISTSPWLMLPPEFKDNNKMVHKFYSLSDNKVVNLSSSNKSVGILAANNEIEFVSSSHGWLTLFNKNNCDLFLYNPISGHQIMLPPIHNLPIPVPNLKGGYGCVLKVIISCSPEQEQDCRVMMSFGPTHRLAFCSPKSADWTLIGDLYHHDPDSCVARVYENFVYSNRQKLFYCVTKWHKFEAWDLQDIDSPKLTPMNFLIHDVDSYPCAGQSNEELELKKLCLTLKYPVVVEESGDLLFVMRHIMPHMAPDGSYVDYDLDEAAAKKLPYMTIGFDVYKCDPKKRELLHMDGGSLDGLSIFIGKNHSFAVSASEFSELKPNSIYYTNAADFNPPKWLSRPYGGHDIGIFNYEDKTFSPCYYPCDRQSIKRIIPTPMWFTPTK